MKYILQLILISMIILLPVFATSCEPTLIIDVENQTDQVITMRVDGNTYFNVSPHSTAKDGTTLTNPAHWLIEGINRDNEIIFSKYYDHTELTTRRGTTLKVQIPFKEVNPYLPIEIENQITDKVEIYANNAFIGWIQPGEKMVKKLFPPDFTSIKIVVLTDPETVINGITHSGPGRIILDKTFNLNELEEKSWKLRVTNP